MIPFPIQFISFYIFGAVFNLCTSIIMFYLRSKADVDKYTKSQLWALTILAWLFLSNVFLNLGEIAAMVIYNQYAPQDLWTSEALKRHFRLYTSFLLLAFGLVYPRPFTSWKRLKLILVAWLFLGVMVAGIDTVKDHHQNWTPIMDLVIFFYLIAIFVPIFIWLGEYSRNPNKEGRMIYTILIWGFLFVVVSSYTHHFIRSFTIPGYYLTESITANVILILLVFIRLSLAMMKHRGAWAAPEKLHIFMVIFSIGVGVGTALYIPSGYEWYYLDLANMSDLAVSFLAHTLGWLLIRPALFSYGLLRYHLLGTQVKAEKALSLLGATLISTLFCLLVVSLGGPGADPLFIATGILAGAGLFYFFWKISEKGVKRLLPMSAGAEGVSMKERRDTYLMGLQTAVVRGTIADKVDEKALQNLRKELRVSKREHDLLMESIAMHESRIAPVQEVTEAFIIHKYGRLITHYRAGDEETQEGTDQDIVAGMFTAVTEFVGETMKRGEAGGWTDAISYGPSTLVIEKEEDIVLAALLTGPVDLELRQLMRDTLSEVNDRHGKVLTEDWDGDRKGLEDVSESLETFVTRVKRREKR
jgi:hypothetical protein